MPYGVCIPSRANAVVLIRSGVRQGCAAVGEEDIQTIMVMST